MAIPYDYYRIFYYVARYHSLTQAAKILHGSQPNVTRAMNRLEEELHCKLFLRSQRGVTLTPEGQRLYAHVSVAYEQLAMGEEELREDAALTRGSVSIGASETALHLLLLDALSDYHEKYPGVRLRITNDTTPQAVAALKRGLIDFAVITTPCQVEKPLRSTVLRSFRDILLGGSQFEALAGNVQELRALTGYPLICLGADTGTYEFYQRFFYRHELPFRVDMEAATMDQVLPMVRHNLGLGFFAEPLAAPAIARGEVCQIPLAEPIPERSVILLEDPSRPQSIAAKTLKQMLWPQSKTPL